MHVNKLVDNIDLHRRSVEGTGIPDRFSWRRRVDLVDEGTVSLDDKLSTWLPDIPHADEVNLGQLAQMTSGYFDFEQSPELNAALYADPFKE